jgi:hypothetical protein
VLSPVVEARAASASTVQKDRSDNKIGFTYGADTGTIGSETSTARADSDGVNFHVGIEETEDSGSGLLGKLTLRLDGDGSATYDGWFTLRVSDASGDVAFLRSRPATITLEPQPGRRRATLRFRFDLPTGNYTAIGKFRS